MTQLSPSDPATRKISARYVTKWLEQNPGWGGSAGNISKTFNFDSIELASKFAARCVRRAADAGSMLRMNVRAASVQIVIGPSGEQGLTKGDMLAARRYDLAFVPRAAR